MFDRRTPEPADAFVSHDRSRLSPSEQRLVEAIATRGRAYLDLLRQSVDIPSATENHDGVRELGRLYAQAFGELGFDTRWVDQARVARAGHFVATRGTRGRRILVIGHLDTVLEGERFRCEGAKAYGSGVADMKAGNLIALEAVRALAAAGTLDACTVRVIFTGDEESTGTPYDVSRAALLGAAADSDLALAFEGHEPGAAVVGRRGFSAWRLRVAGVQGHSSGIFGDTLGSGAVFEAARILTAFHERLREPNLTFNPSVILGGTEVNHDPAASGGSATGKANVVARETIVEGDVRYLTRDQLARARAEMTAIAAASLPRTTATLDFTDGMPSMEPTDANLALLRVLDGCSRDLGYGPIVAHDPARRGAGDVAFVAHALPALDGLGSVGTGEHAPGECIDLDALPMQIERAALLMHRLATAP